MKPFAIALLLSCSFSYSQDILKPILEVENIGSKEALGSGVLGIGDINGDGWPDIAVSARDIWKTHIYFGGPVILDGIADVTIPGGAKIGKGDLNGDGIMDLVIAGNETLYVYLGKPGPGLRIDTIPSLILTTGDSVFVTGSYTFGYSFAIGDINNDGFDDLVVGAEEYKTKGKTFVFMGKPQPTSNPDFTGIGDSTYGEYGRQIGIADINGDGIKDLAISFFRFLGSTRSSCGIDFFWGRSGWRFTKDGYSQRLTSAATKFFPLVDFTLTDYNFDGKADISFSSDSSVYFFYGRSDSIRANYDFRLVPRSSLDAFSSGAIEIGDVNNDGKDDFAFRGWPGGAAVCVHVFLGSTHLQTKSVARLCRGFVSTGAFDQISGVGDVNGDGVNDFATGAPYDPLLGVDPQDGYFVIYSGQKYWVTQVKDEKAIPQAAGLSQNYPNPFNPSTTIEYTLEKKGNVRLAIYDNIGREVSVLVHEEQYVGLHKAVWNGRDSDGKMLSTGSYFYRLALNGNVVETKKLLLIK